MRCFLAFCEEVSASPSAIRLLFRLIEHPRTTHLFTLAESKGSGVSVKKNTKAIVCIGVSTPFFCQALPRPFKCPNSMFSKIKSSLFYGLMHDGIIKFAKEYNVTF